jgi:hypothetical protein
MQLTTIRHKAQQLTKRHGHRMTWGFVHGNAQTLHFGQHGTCRDCGAEVWLNNHSDSGRYIVEPVGGVSAVSVQCTKGKQS